MGHDADAGDDDDGGWYTGATNVRRTGRVPALDSSRYWLVFGKHRVLLRAALMMSVRTPPTNMHTATSTCGISGAFNAVTRGLWNQDGKPIEGPPALGAPLHALCLIPSPGCLSDAPVPIDRCILRTTTPPMQAPIKVHAQNKTGRVLPPGVLWLPLVSQRGWPVMLVAGGTCSRGRLQIGWAGAGSGCTAQSTRARGQTGGAVMRLLVQHTRG